MKDNNLEPTKNITRAQIELGWMREINTEFSKPYMLNLKQFLKSEINKNLSVYPNRKDCFAAFNETPFEKVKVVIIGQDPYHGKGQAHGLCFSVPQGVAIPPSLRNIYKELNSDLGFEPPTHGCLGWWAQQGVFLLNATLTVRANSAGSHQKKGWEEFTDEVIRKLNEKKEGLVFVLWGSYAQKKGQFLDDKRHLIIKAPHPSPLSSHRGFFGSRPFSQINQYLEARRQPPIQWQIPELKNC